MTLTTRSDHGSADNRRTTTIRGWWGLLAAISIIGEIPRLIAARESLAWDELYLYEWVHGHDFGSMLSTVAAKEKTPPLGFMLAWLADQLGGAPQLVRAPAVIAGLAIIPMVGVLARRCFGDRTGLIAAALAAASPMLVFYSVEARSYSLAAALCLASTLLLLKVIDTGSRAAAIGYALTAGAALMSHYTAFGVLAAQAIVAFVAWPDRRRQIALAQAGPILATAVWLPGLIDQTRISADELARIAAVAPLSLDTTATIIGRNLLGHPLVDLSRVPGVLATWLIVAGSALSLGFAATRLIAWIHSADRPRPQHETVMLTAIALAAPTVAIIVSSQPHQSMMFPRNVMTSLPAALVLVAALLARPPRLIAALSTGLVIAGMTIGTFIETTKENRPAANKAAAAVASRWQPGDRIIELCCLTGGDGPLGTALTLNLPIRMRRSVSVLSRTGDRPYVESLADGSAQLGRRAGVPSGGSMGGRGRVFIVGYVPRGQSSPLFFSPPVEWSSRFAPVWRGLWRGMLDSVAVEYRYHGEPSKREDDGNASKPNRP